MQTDTKPNNTDETEDSAADALKKVLAILSKLDKADRRRVVTTVVTFYGDGS